MFDTEKKGEGLDLSTFDIVKVTAFHNTRFWTLMSFVWVWMVLIFKIAILAADTYTCINILIFHRWGTDDFTVYEYKVAKWIFTGCILFRFGLLVYQIAWGVHIYRTRNIALAYLNNYARLMYALSSYDYQCLFHEIDQEGFFEWACFTVYNELDNALEVLAADLPRQVINFMTLRYYATDGDTNDAILSNIKEIATTNLRLAIILSLQLATLVLFLFFFFKFALGMLLFIPIKVKVSHRGFRLLKDFCYRVVNDNVRYLVSRNHKSKTQILEEGIMDASEIRANPLLASQSTFDFSDFGKSPYAQSNVSLTDLSVRAPGDYHRLPPRTQSASSLRENPFADTDSVKTDRSRFMRNVLGNPFADPHEAVSRGASEVDLSRPLPAHSSDQQNFYRGVNASASSTTRLVSSDMKLPQRRPPPLAEHGSRLASLGSLASEASGDGLDHSVDGSQGVDRSLGAHHSRGSGSTDSAEHEDSHSALKLWNDTSTTPYPVRGVSQFYEDNDK